MDWTRLPLARADVDRAAHRRVDPAVLDGAWADAATRVVLVADGHVATRPTTDGGGVELDLRSPADLQRPRPDPTGDRDAVDLVAFLGELAPHGPAYLALVLPAAVRAESAEQPESGEQPERAVQRPGTTAWSTLRDVGYLLSDRDAGLATTAVGLAAWHARHPRCPRCGEPTVAASAGWTRRCTNDGSDHYPRTDPAVIMAVVDADDRILLGHAAHWPEGRYSTLAGFVEPGESLEAAVRREVAEETGVVVTDVDYRGSQPWPFPASLMLAFVARATTTGVTVDGVELTDARWFSRDELDDAVREREILLPTRASVARALIEEWFGGPLAQD